MKLAILCRYFPDDVLGGGEIYIQEIWKRAIKEYDTTLISGYKNDPLLLPPNTKKINLKSKKTFLNYYKFYKEAKKYLKQIKPNIIQSICYEFPQLNIPTVITVCHIGHLLGNTGDSLKFKFQKWLALNRFKKADKLIAISKSTMNDLIKLGIDKNKIHLAYTGINTEKYLPKKTNNEKFTIVYPSRISMEKGQHIAIEAIKLLPEDIQKKVKLQIVGFVNDQDYLNKLKSSIQTLDIKILTNVQKIEDYVMNSDLVIFPTLMWEGFGIVAGEALSAEKPLIYSDFPSIREVTGKYGLFINPRDSKELSKKIQELFLDKKLRERISKGSRRWIIDNFSWDKVYQEHKKVYEELLNKP